MGCSGNNQVSYNYYSSKITTGWHKYNSIAKSKFKIFPIMKYTLELSFDNSGNLNENFKHLRELVKSHNGHLNVFFAKNHMP